MMPVAAYNLLQSISILANAAENFSSRCIEGLRATDRGPELVERGLSICTALVPELGYDLSARISHEAFVSGDTIRAVAKIMSSLTDADLDRLLDPFKMTEPGAK
jgi:fumarate hydratase class II